MKKHTLLLLVLLFFSACGTKTPFKEEKPLNNTALLYIYAPATTHLTGSVDRDSNFRVMINNELISTYLNSGEYMHFFLKPTKVNIEVSKNAIFSQKLTLDLQESHTYFIKVEEQNNEEFSLQITSKEVALQELRTTSLSGSWLDDNSTKNSVVVSKQPDKKSHSSKIDALSKAYKLKKDGVITQEEFIQLKQEILSE